MKSIDRIFSESLKYFAQQEKTQRIFAAKAGISAPYLNDLLSGRRYGEDQTKRKIAAALGYPDRHYEEFLDIGRIIINGSPVPETDKFAGLGDEALRIRGFLPVNYSDQMILDSDDLIQVTEDIRKSHVAVHGASLRRSTASGLQAFRAPDDTMERYIMKNSTVVADLAQNDLNHLMEGRVYVICLEKETGQCTLKYLSWAEKNRTLLICPENSKYKPLVRRMENVKIIGRVIMFYRYC
ncbi:MAG: LexA family transcriptional regulator [Deltaproteobacteria bacterium]|jgi:transcriptional regulator with XRE-family HTH domain|nr:LexA family transcriptional regulator [Deltaproteobacteria bacterium]